MSRPKRIALSTPLEVTKQTQKLINEVLSSGQFSPGPKVREFEEKLADLHQARHCIFVNSGTDALRIALLALKEKYKWQDGDEVLVPALTFVATVNVVLQAGLTPVFVDVEMCSWTMNPWRYGHDSTGREIEADWKRVKAMMPVQLFGQDCDPKLYALAVKYGVKVLEDSCETILNPLRGDVGCHSTYMAHHLATGVGGFALTNDMDLNWLMRSYANHGRNTNYIPGYFVPFSPKNPTIGSIHQKFQFDRIGYSSRATEFEAALGLAQLDGLAERVGQRRKVAEKLTEALESFLDLELPREDCRKNHTWMMYPIILKETAKPTKYEVCLALEKAGIETRDMMPITSQPCYDFLIRPLRNNQFKWSVAERVNERGFYIPCHEGMTEDDIVWIARSFDGVLDKNVMVV